MHRLALVAALAALVAASGCAPTPNAPAPSAPSAGASPAARAVALGHADPALAAWQVPAADVARSPRSADWAARLWNYADADDHNWSIDFGLGAQGGDFSTPVYSTADATTSARVYQRPVANWNGHFDLTRGGTIPWNPSWLPSDGTDAFLLIVDPSTGEEWDVGSLSIPGRPSALSGLECSFDLNNLAAGYAATTDLCAASVTIVKSPDGRVADTRTYRGNDPTAGGGGLQNSAGLATPAEVASGAIHHALKFNISAVASMTGPVCPPDVTTPDDPRVGTSCGLAAAPAGQFENVARTSTPDALAKMVPEGTRIVVDDSDAQIDAWLDQRDYTGTLRATARTFAVALRDYGLIVTDTSGGPASIPVSGSANPTTEAAWRALGIADDGSKLLDGLVTQANIEVLEPATNQCPGGASHRSCWASSTGY